MQLAAMPGHLRFLLLASCDLRLVYFRAVARFSDASFRPYSFASLPFGSFALFNCHGCRGDGCPKVETIGILTKYHFDNIIPPPIYASEKAPKWRAPLFKFIKICACATCCLSLRLAAYSPACSLLLIANYMLCFLLSTNATPTAEMSPATAKSPSSLLSPVLGDFLLTGAV